jgi:hypothetical protein
MKAQVVIGALFINDVKYRRGDIVEVDDIHKYGIKLQEYVEPPKPVKKKVAKKKATKKVEDGED